ncbi:MAG: hypothetical protein NTX94_02945 [Caldiserica bacterium]|nr:hypothetical protein [Caldisericota bacterium]
MNTTAIWVLDVIMTIGMTFAAIAALVIGRKVAQFSRSLSGAMADVRKQAEDLKSEAVRLMQSTEVTEQHFAQLARQLTKLTASADTVVKALPAAASSRNGGLLPRVMSTFVGTLSAYRFFKTIFLRRKS